MKSERAAALLHGAKAMADGEATPEAAVTLAAFRAGMRRLAAGVSLVTTSHDGQRHGFVATAVTSLSGEPPSLLVCINRATSGHDPLLGAGRFCVNVLAREHQALATQFSDSKLRHLRFGEGTWEGDAPVLQGALASFVCRLDQTLSYGSHSIVIGLIEAIRIDAQEPDPLLYFDGAFQTLSADAG